MSILTSKKTRVGYWHGTEPYANQEGQEPSYSCQALIPKTDPSAQAIREEIQKAYETAKQSGKFGKVAPAMNAPSFKLPLRDGDLEIPGDPVYEGMYFVNCRKLAKQGRPKVYDKAQTQQNISQGKPQLAQIQPNLVDAYMEQNPIKSGDYCILELSFYPFNSNGNKGIACGLEGFMKMKEGESLGGTAVLTTDVASMDFDDDEDI